MADNNDEYQKSLALALIAVTRALLVIMSLLFFTVMITVGVNYFGLDNILSLFKSSKTTETTTGLPESQKATATDLQKSGDWKAPDISGASEEVKYGHDLIANTSYYLGPKGIVAPMTNGMNCQNCHLDAGTKYFGNNYSGVAANYPKFRARSGTKESIEKRVNDCMERSLNGKAIDSTSKEMRAIVAYIKWLGSEVPKGSMPNGVGLVELPFLDRAADPKKGSELFAVKCVTCHGANGSGVAKSDGTGYTYPPLWGANSYNIGAGLYRLSRLAGYVKANMPLGATKDNPQLTDEEAWDIAAFINTQPRPAKDLRHDWPDISKKPVDHPFGPYSDGFSEAQHKLGPFGPIKKLADEKKKKSEQAKSI